MKNNVCLMKKIYKLLIRVFLNNFQIFSDYNKEFLKIKSSTQIYVAVLLHFKDFYKINTCK